MTTNWELQRELLNWLFTISKTILTFEILLILGIKLLRSYNFIVSKNIFGSIYVEFICVYLMTQTHVKVSGRAYENNL